ncbi:MAG: hypothetical protein WBD56_03715 [Anaerolineales bacterium]
MPSFRRGVGVRIDVDVGSWVGKGVESGIRDNGLQAVSMTSSISTIQNFSFLPPKTNLLLTRPVERGEERWYLELYQVRQTAQADNRQEDHHPQLLARLLPIHAPMTKTE